MLKMKKHREKFKPGTFALCGGILMSNSIYENVVRI